MSQFMKRTWAEINLNALEYNFHVIKRTLSPKTKLMCVVKADAYGHGAEFVSKEYESLGADWFGVSNLDEAIQLRECGIKKPILVLGYTPVNMSKELAQFNITQTVFSIEYALELNDSLKKIGKTADVHIKVDTGMNRIGFTYQSGENDIKSIDQIESVCKLESLHVKGIFTHFAVSDENDKGKKYTEYQFENFMDVINLLEKRGISFELKHCCNSGAIIDYPQMHLDIVRAGVILYGLQPSNCLRNKIHLKPVMELKTVVSQVKKIRPHSFVSYGRTYESNHEMTVATVPIGYADGYLRSLSGVSSMLINGKRVNVIGRICMDQLMLDVSSVNDVQENQVVTVFGRDGDGYLSVDELATLAGTINYEFVCLIGKRVPRTYIKNGESVSKLNYILRKDQS